MKAATTLSATAVRFLRTKIVKHFLQARKAAKKSMLEHGLGGVMPNGEMAAVKAYIAERVYSTSQTVCNCVQKTFDLVYTPDAASTLAFLLKNTHFGAPKLQPWLSQTQTIGSTK